MNHATLVELASRREDLAIDLANYRTAQQLALDGNLPGEQRREWAALAETARHRLIGIIEFAPADWEYVPGFP